MLKNGLRYRELWSFNTTFEEETGSSAENDITTIWMIPSKEVNGAGQKRNNSLNTIIKLVTNGPKFHDFWMEGKNNII